MSSQSFNRKSLLLSGPACSGKSTKINAIVALAKECGLKVVVNSSSYSTTMDQIISDCGDADVVVCHDVQSVTHLGKFVDYHTTSGKQFILATNLSVDDLTSEDLKPVMESLKLHKFDVVPTYRVDRGIKTSLPLEEEWARQHFLVGDSSTACSTSTSVSAIPADSEKKVQV